MSSRHMIVSELPSGSIDDGSATSSSDIDSAAIEDSCSESPGYYGSLQHHHHNGLPFRSPPASRLPPELVTTLFTYLESKQDQWAFVMTCRTWFNSCVEGIWFRPTVSTPTALILFLRTLRNQRLSVPYGSLVRRLNLTNVASAVDDQALLSTGACTHLERLTLASCGQLTDRSLVAIVSRNPNIQSIDISNLELLSDVTVLAIADTCRQLQGLYVTGCKLLTNASVVALSESCPMLKRIKLNGCTEISDDGVLALVANCPLLVELDLAGCVNVSDSTITRVLQGLSQLREFRLASNSGVTDEAFMELKPPVMLEKLRIIDLTSCVLISDTSVERLVKSAPRLRNVVLAKCVNITDRGIHYLTQLEASLHYLHLGHCSNITDRGINMLVRRCQKIQYIDVACCTQLTNAAVKDLSTLPKLRRIGLVKCQNITDIAIYSLAQRQGQDNTLERVHLSYCGNITLFAIMQLVNACERLTHLSLTGVPPFMRHDLTQFCRDPPPEFTQHQQAVFCVFSGAGVVKLRHHLNSMMAEQRRLIGDQMGHLPPVGAPPVQYMPRQGLDDDDEEPEDAFE
jgi:F-box and leucine-rich repeat protein GRR1